MSFVLYKKPDGKAAVIGGIMLDDQGAHIDFNAPLTDPEQEVGGMALKDWESGVHDLTDADIKALFPNLDAHVAQVKKSRSGDAANFDPDQPRDDAGRWTDGGGSDGGGENESGITDAVLRVSTIDEAIPLILAGKTVELGDTKSAHTVMTKLAAITAEAKALGKDAPNYDLCSVSVQGTNLFCAESLGIARIDMPQMAGKNADGKHVDVGPAFVESMRASGIAVAEDTELASRLRASQRELNGPKVAAMMLSPTFNTRGERIYVSRDNYIIDGHHRWAATVGRDAEDGKLGDLVLDVYKIDAPISWVLQRANEFTRAAGIAGRSVATQSRILDYRPRA